MFKKQIKIYATIYFILFISILFIGRSKATSEYPILPSLNYQQIQHKAGNIRNLSITHENGKVQIETQDIEDNLKSTHKIGEQPAFVDILFLQMQIIKNLKENIKEQNTSFNFENMFTLNSDYNDYITWKNNLTTRSSKSTLIDSKTDPITLKDIGTAQKIIYRLYDCSLNGSCENTIMFGAENPTNKYNTYSLNNISHNLYENPGNNILSKAIQNYQHNKSICGGNLSQISDDFLREQVGEICAKINDTSVNKSDFSEIDQYQFGYFLGEREKNLNTIKNNIPSNGLNLLGIYNIYHEIDKLNIGENKMTYIKKALDETDINQQYDNIKQIFKKEIQYFNEGIIGYNSIKKVKIEKMKEMLDQDSHLNLFAKNYGSNINIFDDISVESLDRSYLTIIEGITYIGKSQETKIELRGNQHTKKDNKNLTISPGEIYENQTIKVSFDIEVGGGVEGTTSSNTANKDVFNVENEDETLFTGDYHIGDTQRGNKQNPIKKTESIEVELDDDGKATLNFIFKGTADNEYINISNISY